MASPLDVTALLLYYRSRMEHDLHANALLFDITTQCNVVCTHNTSEATLDSLLPPFSPLSLSALSDCLPDQTTAPVRSARGRQCLDVCVSRYLDVSGYTRRRMGRTVSELVRVQRMRERRREKEREREAAAVTSPAQVSGRQGVDGVG